MRLGSQNMLAIVSMQSPSQSLPHTIGGWNTSLDFAFVPSGKVASTQKALSTNVSFFSDVTKFQVFPGTISLNRRSSKPGIFKLTLVTVSSHVIWMLKPLPPPFKSVLTLSTLQGNPSSVSVSGSTCISPAPGNVTTLLLEDSDFEDGTPSSTNVFPAKAFCIWSVMSV